METKGIQSFNVKDSSLNEFFEKYYMTSKDELRRGDTINPYYLMKDEIILKKSIVDDIGFSGSVHFELFDETRMGKKLIHHYTYSIDPYDSMSVKLSLVDFKVTY